MAPKTKTRRPSVCRYNPLAGQRSHAAAAGKERFSLEQVAVKDAVSHQRTKAEPTSSESTHDVKTKENLRNVGERPSVTLPWLQPHPVGRTPRLDEHQVANYLVSSASAQRVQRQARALDAESGAESLVDCLIIPAAYAARVFRIRQVLDEPEWLGELLHTVQEDGWQYIFSPPSYGSLLDEFQPPNSIGFMSEGHARELFSQILNIVDACHQHDVVIRDLTLQRFGFADKERYVCYGSCCECNLVQFQRCTLVIWRAICGESSRISF